MFDEEGITADLRRIGEILNPALARLDTSDQARAYGAWARAAGDAVAANARPRAFARGVLTVECASSIWAQELTYLGGQLLARMTEIDPSHPVRRLRFMTRRSPAADGDEATALAVPRGAHLASQAGQLPTPPTRSSRQDGERSSSNKSRRDDAIHRADLDAARQGASEVGDERMRAAILAALGAVADDPPQQSPGGPSVNRKK